MIEIKHRETGAVLHTVQADTLIGADLSGLDLRGSFLIGSDLRGADLRDACLIGADLRGANPIDADMSGAVIIPGWKMIKEA